MFTPTADTNKMMEYQPFRKAIRKNFGMDALVRHVWHGEDVVFAIVEIKELAPKNHNLQFIRAFQVSADEYEIQVENEFPLA